MPAASGMTRPNAGTSWWVIWPRALSGTFIPASRYTGSCNRFTVCQASLPNSRNTDENIMPSPYMASIVRPNTSSSNHHDVGLNAIWKIASPAIRMVAARTVVVSNPPIAIPVRMPIIGAGLWI